MARALEAGFSVVPDGADLRVVVAAHDQGVEISVATDLKREQTLVSGGEVELVDLEVLQRALSLVEELAQTLPERPVQGDPAHTPGPEGQSPPPKPTPKATKAALVIPGHLNDPRLIRLIELLVARGVRLHPEVEQNGVPRLCFPQNTGRIEVSVAPAGMDCAVRTVVALPEKPTLREFEEGANLIVAWVVQEQTGTPEESEGKQTSPTEDDSPSSVKTVSGPNQKRLAPGTPASAKPHVLGIAVQAGVAFRGRTPEANVRVSAWKRIAGPLGLEGGVSVLPNWSRTIDTMDLFATAGPSARGRLGQSQTTPLWWRVSVQGGVHLHRYHVQLASSDPGTKAGWSLLLPATVDVFQRGPWSMNIGALAGISQYEREHRLRTGDVLYHRQAWMIGAMIGGGYFR